MSNTDTERARAIVAAFVEVFGGETTKQSDPRQVFERIADHVEGLEMEAVTPDQLQPGSTIARRGRGGVVQIYQLLAIELYRRIDGRMSQVAIWVTNCRSCGREFEVRTAATQRAVEHAIRMGLVVRCRRHRRRSKSRRSE